MAAPVVSDPIPGVDTVKVRPLSTQWGGFANVAALESRVSGSGVEWLSKSIPVASRMTIAGPGFCFTSGT